jgi:hypothetical protein
MSLTKYVDFGAAKVERQLVILYLMYSIRRATFSENSLIYFDSDTNLAEMDLGENDASLSGWSSPSSLHISRRSVGSHNSITPLLAEDQQYGKPISSNGITPFLTIDN